MSTDLKAIMLHHARVAEIINDPDLTSDAKLFAVCLVVDIGNRREMGAAEKRVQARREGGWVTQVAALAGRSPHWGKMVIADDVPTYVTERGTGVCVAGMIRREGLCGKRPYRSVNDTNPVTGARVQVGYCTRHWELDYEIEAQRQTQEWSDNGKPTPGPNHGGTLKRHFSADWARLYAWAAPYKTAMDGAKEPVLPRPKLTLVRGEAR